uniref:Nedd4 family interacting protein 1 n=1 Tax=Astatotilapia calliptera TaxID=8154 RepID=A0AAX7VMC4_ASTCA
MAESSPRYQQLTNEEDSEESPQVAADAPPPYSSVTADNSAFFDCKEDGIFPKPPSYNVATTLPSYDEAERTKAETNVPLVPGRDEDFVTRDDFEDADQLRIGNDGIFMLTFFMAFLFNWIGFFLSFCLTTSAAGRYGAISGFGLSLVKWILIVRASCSSSEDSSTMPESARWRTLSPPCPAPGSSSSTKPLHSFVSCFYSETHC